MKTDQASIIDIIAAGLEALGYSKGPPPWLKEAVVAIDRQACADSPCAACGHEGLAFHPFYKSPRAYTVIACCEWCGHCEEA